MSYAVTKSRIAQWIGIILIIGVFAGAYWYFKVFAGVKTNSSQTSTLTSGLVGMWSFDGADVSGTTATDRSGSSNTGTISGAVVTQGKVGQALSFDGINDSVTAATAASLQVSTGTISAWIKTSGAGSSYRAIVVKGNAYGLFLKDNVLMLYDWGASADRSTGVTLSDGSWHYVTEVFQSGVSNGTTVYVDGVLVLTTTMTVSSQAVALGIGDSIGNSQFFNGSIDEARIYNRVLSAGEIQSLYALGQSDEQNTGASQAQGGSRLDSGLAGYWAMDNGSGTSATDSSTNSNTGTLTNGPTWTTGQISGAVNFDGTNDYIDAGTAGLTSPTRLSGAAWINSTVVFGVNHVVFSNRTAGNQGWSLVLNSSAACGSANCAYLQFVIQGVASYTTTVALVPSSQWAHVAFTWDGSRVYFYINGAFIESQSTGAMTTGTNLLIGAMGPSSSASSYMSGKIDEARIYTRILSTDEISQLYRVTTPTAVDTTLKGYWSFNGSDISGTTAYDRSGAGNTGTLTNGPSVTPGKIGQALNFDGSNDYISVPDSSALDSTSEITISTWVQADSWTGEAGTATIVKKDKNYILRKDTATGSAKLLLYWWDGTNIRTINTANLPSTGEWHHIVGVATGNDASKLYVDGVSVGSTASTYTTQARDLTNILEIGSGATASESLDGRIDEVRIYNRALSAVEIQAQYAAGQSDEVNTGASQAQGTGRLDSGLAGYWKLDDGSGTSATDSSTNANTGTLTNGPTWTTGQIGGALDFDGVDDVVNAGSNTSLDDVTKKTVSVWIKPDSLGENSLGYIVRKIGAALTNGWVLFLCNSNVTDCPSTANTVTLLQTGNARWHMPANSISFSGSWIHVLFTYDSSSTANDPIFYLNGTKVTTTEASAPSSITSDAAADLLIGNSANGDRTFDGSIDELRVYNRILSDAEVAELYRLNAPTGTETSLKGYWSFNGKDLSGTTAYDRSGAGNTGTLTNGPTVTPGKLGQALQFDGTDDHVVAGTTSSWDSLFSSGLTFSAWVKFPNFSSFQRIITSPNTSNVYDAWLQVNQTTGLVQVGAGGSGKYKTGTTALTANTWYHVVGVTDYTNGGTKVYVNGVDDGGTVNTTPSYTADRNALHIGRLDTSYATGSLDEVRIYNRALTAAEVYSLYNASK